MKPTVPPEPPRWQRFNDTTGAISWNRRSANLHPDRCVCQELERGQNAGTPHKHYDEPPHACARCSECEAYRPAVPAVPPEPAPPTSGALEFEPVPPGPTVRFTLEQWATFCEHFGIPRDDASDFGEVTALGDREACECATCGRSLHPNAKCPTCSPTPTPAASPLTVAPARPAREVAHEQAQAPSLRFPCQGGEVDHDGMTYAHTATCDHWTEAIERDRASRSPGLDEARELLWRLRGYEAMEDSPATEDAGVDLAAAFDDWYARNPGPSALRGEGPSPAREEEK